jgi:hypothetical protein
VLCTRATEDAARRRSEDRSGEGGMKIELERTMHRIEKLHATRFGTGGSD